MMYLQGGGYKARVREGDSSDLDIYKSPGPPPHSRVVVLDTVVKK